MSDERRSAELREGLARVLAMIYAKDPALGDEVVHDPVVSRLLEHEPLQRSDREITRRVHTSILPQATSAPDLEIAATMIPAEEVGGDYYDVHAAPDGCWIGIGDVAGHGLDAGLIMLMVQSATATLARTRPRATPSELLCDLNGTLFENIRERLAGDAHVTFTLLRYRSDGTLLFSGAHEDIVIVRRGGRVETHRTPGTWLGARPDIRRATVDDAIKLDPGDLVLLYTDGLTEARNAEREQWNIARLCAAGVRLREEPVAAIRDTILAEVAEFAPLQDDDRTLMVLRYTGSRGPRPASRMH